jgi:hypothetical protein
VVSYRRFKDADELASLVADDLALLLTERSSARPLRRPSRRFPRRAGRWSTGRRSCGLSPGCWSGVRSAWSR